MSARPALGKLAFRLGALWRLLPRYIAGGLPSAPAVAWGANLLLKKTVWNHLILLDTRDLSVAPIIALDGCWELGVSLAMRKLVEPGMQVVEVGANVGYFTAISAGLAGSTGRVTAFEANPAVAELCATTIVLNGYQSWATVANVLVGARSGRASFFVRRRHHGGSTAFEPTPELLRLYRDEAEEITVDMVSLDDHLCGDRRSIDLLRMDAEGSEPEIIRGMPRLLEENPTITIVTEFLPDNLRRAGESPEGFLHMLRDMGFALRRITPLGRIVATTTEKLLASPRSEIVASRKGGA